MREMELYRQWRDQPLDDPDLIREIEEIEGKEDEIYDRFYRDLEFGTAGLRGIIGAGTNRMNIYTVRRATQGYAQYLKTLSAAPAVAIACDSRIKSELFAMETACVMAANGVRVYIYRELMPTPALSYAVRVLGCQGGVVVTASHNPAAYNGYKAYDQNGCQLSVEASAQVLEQVNSVDIFKGVQYMDFSTGLATGVIKYITEDLVDSYIARILKERLNPGIYKDCGFKLVYSPLNGAGRRCVTQMLKGCGIEDVTIVPEQQWPDGNFPTCPYPNPEVLQAMEKGLALCKKLGADLMLATDPDCDRVGAAVLDKDGEPRLISGNEMGVLMLDYIARSRLANGTMPKDPIVVRSIVTTNMVDAVAARYGIQVVPVLTGFKYIGEEIRKLEEKCEEDRFILGFEESYGYLTSGYVRDKDAVDASLIICEMAAWYKWQHKTLGEALDDLYAQYGTYLNKVESYAFAGADGMKKMAGIMESLRANPPKELAGREIGYVTDYQTSLRTAADGSTTPITLPRSNVLELGLDVGTVIVRPSGTEPKLKVYYSLRGADRAEAEASYNTLSSAVKSLLGL